MAKLDRRRFLGGSIAIGGGVLAGCSDLPVVDMPVVRDGGFAMDAGVVDAGLRDAGVVASCDDPFANGVREATLEFLDEAGVRYHELRNEGWDGRLYTDLGVVDHDTLTIGNDEFYVRTRYPDLLDASAPWVLEVDGLAAPQTIPLAELQQRIAPRGRVFLECSGNGSGSAFGLMSAAEWSGIAVADVLAMIAVDPAATRVEVIGFDEHSVPSNNGHSTPGASWIFTFDELLDAGAFFATEMNGVPLPPDHGAPVRLLVPGWYGCAQIKWVTGLRFVDESEPASSQMLEFASRTHQPFGAQLAREFRPATMDQSAMPTRVERHTVDGETIYRVLGILWGGSAVTERLAIRFDDGPLLPVEVCPPQQTNRTWTLWEYAWRPLAAKRYRIRMAIDDPAIPTNRLDAGYYDREVDIPTI